MISLWLILLWLYAHLPAPAWPGDYPPPPEQPPRTTPPLVAPLPVQWPGPPSPPVGPFPPGP